MKKLTNQDYCDISKKYNLPISSIKAVATVESGGRGGFDEDGRLLIRFEGHKFRSFTNGKYDKTHPKVSYTYGQRNNKTHRYEAFNEAFELDSHAAMLSTSYGMFQPMGFNHQEMDYDTVGEMLDDFKKGEREQLDAFIRLIIKWGLADELRRATLQDFIVVAKRYNGADYATNNYHNKMVNYKKQFDKNPIDCSKSKNPLVIDKEDDFVVSPSDNEDEQTFSPDNKTEQVTSEETKTSTETTAQEADQITNIDNSQKSVPDNFVPEDKEIQAPAPANVLSKGWKWLLGLGLIPTTGSGAVEAIKNLSSDGTIRWSDVFEVMKQIMIFLMPYLFWIAMVFIIGWIVKEIFKQISFIVNQYTLARGDMNNVTILPTSNKPVENIDNLSIKR